MYHFKLRGATIFAFALCLWTLTASNWKNRSIQTGINTFAYEHGKYLGIGSQPAIWTSTNGVIWTGRHMADLEGTVYASSIAFGAGTFVMVGEAGIIMTSTNGEDWVRQSSPTTGYIQQVIWGETNFMAILNSTSFESPDGVRWTQKYGGGVGVAYGAHVFVKSDSSIAFGNGFFVELHGTNVGQSSNGLSRSESL